MTTPRRRRSRLFAQHGDNCFLVWRLNGGLGYRDTGQLHGDSCYYEKPILLRTSKLQAALKRTLPPLCRSISLVVFLSCDAYYPR